MSTPEKPMSEQESLQLITDMIQKAKASYYETGISPLLWGSAVFAAAMLTFLQQQFQFRLPFDIWLIVLFAIIPQVIISIRESKHRKFRNHTDIAIDAVWLTYAITLFGLVAYQNIVPAVSENLIHDEGWQMVKRFTNTTKPDEIIAPFSLSMTSIYMLIYAFPTLITGIVKQFKPMLWGAIVSYGFFTLSLFTAFKYDMLLAAATALACWFIPGIILRKMCLKQKGANV